ncbi:nuclear exosome regulator NRDE2 [Armigeres subalbatus]|uniref:nuclear exosome regulator NRDE2 n=1 Tax=Armigeres subalbatus TaxID=124917 RepID=UPI002ED05D1D
MSLFPAYSTDSISVSQVPVKPTDLAWLTNQSFIAIPSTAPAEEDSEVSELEESKPSSSHQRKRKKKKKHHKKGGKRHRKHSSSGSDSEVTNRDEQKKVESPPMSVSELEYYTDVDALKIYLTVETLHRPACPKYKLGPYRFPQTGRGALKKRNNAQRYFRYFRKWKEVSSENKVGGQAIDKEMQLEKAARSDSSVDKWIEYYQYKKEHPMHFDSYQNHKAELAIVERAMQRHPDDELLMELYLEGIVKVYPTDEVLELIQKQIKMDNTNVQLWDALIANKQSSMAQCIVPNVLKLYEKSIRSLFLAKRSDEVMLKFFKKCAIFCRQAGLWEQFFALIQLTVSLNVSANFASGKHLFVSPDQYSQLIEYEELILKSGLPMNEIWLRIEKLRSAFHFLPFQGSQMCSDPQRMVLQEDIVGFVYPLINREYSFDLVILVLKLMKYPFESNAFERCSFFKAESYESDHPEQILSLFLNLTRDKKKDSIILNLIKELTTPPSFINTNLAFESYLDVLREFLVSAAEHFSDVKNVILLLLYLRLERILLVFDRNTSPLDDQRKKATRTRVKNLLKRSKYQNNLNFYIEYGLIEYEMEGLGPSCLKIFNTSVQVFCGQDDKLHDNDLYGLVVRFVEILLKEGKMKQAIGVLTKLALNPTTISFESTENVSDPSKLLALQKLNDRVSQYLSEDFHAENMPVEQYFITSPLTNSIYAYLYYLALIKSKAETVKRIDGLLFHFNDQDNPMHRFIREQIYEIYLKVLEFRLEEFTTDCFLQVVDRVLHEYPENLTTIRMCTFSESLSWFQIRTILGKHLTVKSVLLMVTAARIRSLYAATHPGELENSSDDQVYKRRILNLLKHSLRRDSPLRQNALLWRLYLRELFDQPSSLQAGDNALEQCKRTLYLALEACPWNKMLYLDGAFFAPQELSQLLDLLMEKQLRIHAVPEELEILRNE